MKKSKTIQLILITAALASCQQKKKEPEWGSGKQNLLCVVTVLHLTQEPITAVECWAWRFWFYAFRPYGNYNNGMYSRAGYYSGAIPTGSNISSNAYKGNVTRGGFGRGGYSVGS